MDRFYPNIDEKNLRLIKKLYDENSDYFNDPRCPYSDDIKSLFSMPEIVSDFDDNMDTDLMNSEEHILKEINTLYNHLKKFGQGMRDSDTASEKNTYFKLSTTLLEKLISMRERVINIKKINDFTETILRIMEEELNTDDRSRIIDKLREVMEE